MENFTSKIKESTRDLNAKERIFMKDTSNATKIDKAIDEFAKNNERFIITPTAWAVLEIHNEKSKDRKDYENYVIIDESGEKYVTGSPSFWRSFREIWDEMTAESDEAFQIVIYKKPSNNYNGKDFITCSII